MSLVPWDSIRPGSEGQPSPVPQPLANLARGLRDGYCEVVPRIPLVRDTPFHRLMGGAICQGTEHPPTYIGGQCPLEYRVQTTVQGFATNLTPKQSLAPTSSPVRLWGPIEDARVVPDPASSSRWRVEVLCRGRETATPAPVLDWYVIGSTDVGFTRNLPGTVVNITAVPEPGNDDDCYIEPVIPPGEIIQPGQPAFDIDINPTFDITLPPIIAPVTVLAPIIAPRFEVDLGDNQTIDVEFTFEGINIIDNSSMDVDLSDTSLEIINNNTENQITNLGDTLTQVINQGNQQLALDISNEIAGAIELSVSNTLNQYFSDNPIDVDVDLSPVLSAIAVVRNLIENLEFPEVDLQPVLDRIELAQTQLTELLELRFDDVDKALECLLSSVDGSYVLNSLREVLTATSTHENNVFTVTGFSPSARFADVTILDFDPRTVRTYKLSGDPNQVEVGFGNLSRLKFNAAMEFRVISTKFNFVDLTYVEPGNLPALRISLKPGITFRVRQFLYDFEPFECE